VIDDGEMTRIILGLAIVGVVGIATVGVLAAYRMLREIDVALRDASRQARCAVTASQNADNAAHHASH
jgi:hypothetical protein